LHAALAYLRRVRDNHITMWSQFGPLQRLGGVTVAGLLLAAMGYFGAQHMRSTPSLVLEGEAPAPTAQPAPTKVIVHVAGAVRQPGVYELPPTARVNDAIQAAGGSLEDADLEALNLAMTLIDGSQVNVPTKEPAPSAQGSPPPPRREISTYSAPTGVEITYAPRPVTVPPPANSQPKASAPPTGAPSGKISLNSATKAQLETLPGIGPALAQRILDYREQHSGFASVEELIAVSGIGEKKLDQIRPFVRL
jgi:competence protein ComEA